MIEVSERSAAGTLLTSPSFLLNVDDDQPSRTARSNLLAEAGYAVIEANNGAEALEIALARLPSLVLLDLNIPDMDSLEVCRQIKSSPETARIPVLQISAHSIPAPQQAEALNSGADSFLVEPVDRRVLLATIRALLRLSRAEEDLLRANGELQQRNEDLARANEALKRSNEDLERFSYMASHDLQSPLRTVGSFATLLNRRYRGKIDAQADKYLEFIQSGIERMGTLISDLLSFSQTGHEESHIAVDSLEALQWALQDLKIATEESKAQITYTALPQVRGNSTQVAQLFQNLIGNAVKYRQPEASPVIHIAAERQSNGFWKFSITDNGIGLEKEYLHEVFIPFKRLHGAELPGTGIGLATCRRIVEHHGGKIWVESDGPGKGSVFHFTFPEIEKR